VQAPGLQGAAEHAWKPAGIKIRINVEAGISMLVTNWKVMFDFAPAKGLRIVRAAKADIGPIFVS
jgi:hypothetical protein